MRLAAAIAALTGAGAVGGAAATPSASNAGGTGAQALTPSTPIVHSIEPGVGVPGVAGAPLSALVGVTPPTTPSAAAGKAAIAKKIKKAEILALVPICTNRKPVSSVGLRG
jgi:hypothetical protein